MSLPTLSADGSGALLLLAGLVVAGTVAQWLAARLRIPAIILLLATGIVLGPLLGWLRPDEVFGELLPPVVSLAVAVILFEGGLSLRFSEARKLGAPLYALVFGGLAVTFAASTFLAHTLAGLSWATSAVIGGILVVTGPTVIKPMLRSARLDQRPARLLKWEGIVNDPLGALAAVVALEVAILSGSLDHEEGVGAALTGLFALAVIAGLLGLGAGFFLSRAMDRGWIPEHLKTPANFAACLGVFALSDTLQSESGLVAVTVMGVAMANLGSPNLEDVRRFKEEVTTLFVALLFLVLSARLELGALGALGWGGVAFIAAVLFLVRPLAAWTTLPFTGLRWQEIALIGWIAPRGVVAAAMAAALEPELLAAGYADANMLVPVLFGVIIATVVLHGLTIRPLSRKLDVAAHGGEGVLILGAASWVIDLARALRSNGVPVALTDSNYRNTTRARMEGLEAVHGNILSEETLDELPLERMGWMLAATDDSHFNALACVSLAKVLARERVLQVTPESARATEHADPHLQGRTPWGEAGTFSALAARYWSGKRVKVTTLSEEFGWEAFQEQQPGALVLFVIGEKEIALPAEGDGPKEGSKLVYLP